MSTLKQKQHINEKETEIMPSQTTRVEQTIGKQNSQKQNHNRYFQLFLNKKKFFLV